MNERKIVFGPARDGLDPNDWSPLPLTDLGGRWGRSVWSPSEPGEDRQLASELLALPAARRAAVAVRERRFHRDSLARLLALEAEEELFAPDGDARPAASAAAAIAGALMAADGEMARLAALSWWLLGKGLLRSGHCRLALEAFGSIRPLVPRIGESSMEGALLSVGVAQGCEDRGWMSGATVQWLRAAVVFHQLGAGQPAAACQALLGFHLIDWGDHENAAKVLGLAAAVLDPAVAPALASRAWLGLAEARAAMGEVDGAAAALGAARGLYSLERSVAETAARLWWEGRIAAAGMRDGEAEQRLSAAREVVQMHGGVEEAVQVAWDQVALRLDSGRGPEVGSLVAPLREASAVGARWAAEFEGVARRATTSDGYRVRMEITSRLRRLRSGGGGRLVVPSRMLGDEVMRFRRRAEGSERQGAAVLGARR